MMLHIDLVWLLGVVTLIRFTEGIDICGNGTKLEGTQFTVRQFPNQDTKEGAHGCQCTIEAKDNLSLLTSVTFSYQPGSRQEQPSGCPPLLRWEEEPIYNCARMRSDNKTNEGGIDGGNDDGNDNNDGGHGYADERHVNQRKMTQGKALTFSIHNPGNFDLQMKVDIAALNGKLSISCQQHQQTVSEDVCPCRTDADPKSGAWTYDYHCHLLPSECHYGFHILSHRTNGLIDGILICVIILLVILYALYELCIWSGRKCTECTSDMYRSCIDWMYKKDKTEQAEPEGPKELEEI